MRQETRLFIEGREVEFSTPPQILFTYTQNELTNPSVIRNSYTKTLTIEGTPNNNNIFGHIWDLSRLQSYGTGDFVQTEFDPARKADFTLYYNGEIYESGYVKLDQVRRTGHKIEMDLTLYGGLGGLFFDLQYDAEGNKLKLSDLQYIFGSDDTEFDMVISKETVKEAWDYIYSNSSKWSSINFAPLYEGDPADNFDTDRCVVNFNNAAIFSATTESGTTYVAKNGYGLGMLPEKMDMWATRDIRSYLLRPVLRVKALFDAIQRYAVSKGYELILDPDFFHSDNVYFWDSWITLPLLSEMKLNGVDEESGVQVAPTVTMTTTYNGWYDTVYRIGGDMPMGVSSVDLNMDFLVSGSTAITSDLFTSAMINGQKNYAAFAVQLCAYEGDSTNSTFITGSTAMFLTSKVGTDYLKPDQTVWTPAGTGEYKNSFGKWERTGSGTWKWSEPLSFHLDLPSNVGCLGLRVNALANLESVTTYSGKQAQSYGYRRGKAYTSTTLAASTSANTTSTLHYRDTLFNSASMDCYSKNGTAGFSGARVSKKILLNTEDTPCDYLLSFCKMFNLFFLKEPNNKQVNILMRGNFYNTGDTVNVNDKIDRGSQMKITPIPYESMWYNLSQDQVEGAFSEQYFNTYGVKYGTQRINTGYEFDVTEKKILDKSVFKSCVEGTEKSRYYTAPERFAPSNEMPSYVLQGFKYLLYNGEDTFEVDMGYKDWEFKPLNTELYYDMFPKPQFRDAERKGKDGKNVLLFLNGYQDCRNADGVQVPYWITDDLGNAMGGLNNQKACWIYTEDEYDRSGKQIAIKTYSLPKFQRNMYGWNGAISRSWDFGAPRQLFTDNAFWVNEAGIYYSFWRDYLKDFYSTDTRVVNAQMLIEQRPNPDFLRKFYWFDNTVWRLNKIDEWNVSNHGLTNVEFVRVNDTENYKTRPVTSAPTITFTLSKYTANKNGDTIEGYIHTSDGGGWSIERYDPYEVGLSAEQGTGDATITITVYTNSTGYDREIEIYAMADNSSAKVTILQASGTLYVDLVNADNVDGAGGTVRGYVYSTDPWTASTDYTGILTAITPSTGIGLETGEEILISVAPNDYETRRTAYIKVDSDYRHARSSNITQNGAGNPVVYLSGGNQYLGQSGGTFTLTASANCDYQISITNPDWITVTPTGGTTGETQHTFTVAANRGYRRATTIAAKNSFGTTTISADSVLVTQSGVTYIVYAAGANYGPRAATPTNLETGFLDANGNYLTAITTNTYSAYENNYIMTFGEDVVKITNGAMSGMNAQYLELYYVSLPDTVTEVSNNAFAGNNYLSSVTTSAQTITTGAFRDNRALTVLNLGNGVQTIGDYAFYGDSALTSVTIPSTVTAIGPYAFGGCTGLAMLYYGGTVSDWENISLDTNWRANTPLLTQVVCADGTVQLESQAGFINVSRIDGGGNISSTGGTCYLNVSASETWTASTPYTGIITGITPTTGSAGNTTVTVRFAANEYQSVNQVYIDFTGETKSTRIYLTQQGSGDPYVKFTPSDIYTVRTGGTFTIQASANTEWTPYYYASWITCNPAFNETVPSGVTTLEITVDVNTGSTRSTTFVAYRGNGAVPDSSMLIRQYGL